MRFGDLLITFALLTAACTGGEGSVPTASPTALPDVTEITEPTPRSTIAILQTPTPGPEQQPIVSPRSVPQKVLSSLTSNFSSFVVPIAVLSSSKIRMASRSPAYRS